QRQLAVAALQELLNLVERQPAAAVQLHQQRFGLREIALNLLRQLFSLGGVQKRGLAEPANQDGLEIRCHGETMSRRLAPDSGGRLHPIYRGAKRPNVCPSAASLARKATSRNGVPFSERRLSGRFLSRGTGE